MARYVSRRNLLKGAATGVAGLGLMGLVGCSGNTDAQPAPSQSEQTQNPQLQPQAQASQTQDFAKYEVINSDLLIIGAGFGATMAAFTAIQKGKRVTIVEKAPFRHGGMGYNWDVEGGWLPDKDLWSQTLFMRESANTELSYRTMQEYPSEDDELMYLQRGCCLPIRNEDGSQDYYADFDFYRQVEGFMPRNIHDELLQSPLVTIVDQTMVTDLFINDGRCLGAVGLYLPTGDVRVFRADATINATGPTTWFYGWNTVSAYTISSPDSTGDVDMSAFRHGAGIAESEFSCLDYATAWPSGMGFGWCTMLNIDAIEYEYFADKNGDQIFTPERFAAYGFSAESIHTDRAGFNQFLARLVANENITTEDGFLLCSLANVKVRKCMQKNLDYFKKIGVDFTAEPVPIHEECMERGGTPMCDLNLMSEDIEGVFFTRAAGTGQGTDGGSYVSAVHRTGYYAVLKALEYIDNAIPVAEIDWAPVEKEVERLHEILNRDVEDGIRPHALRHSIQKTCGKSLGIVRSNELLDDTITELERIRDEDLPRMVVSMKSPTWNREWKEAIENYNLLDAAMLAAVSSRKREETRGHYLNLDFPEKDDQNWLCSLVAKKGENGEISWEKRKFPQHEPFGSQS